MAVIDKRTKKPDKRDEKWPIIYDKKEAGLRERRSFEGQWIVNLAFLAGRQYTAFNTGTHTLQAISNNRGRKRKVDNLLISRWKRQVSDLIRNKPKVAGVPATNEDEDIESARIATKALEHFHRENKMRTKLRKLSQWIFACGNGFLDDRWNDKIGPTQVDKETGKLMYLGDADCGVWSPFEVITPVAFAGDTNIHSFPWIIKIKWRELTWIANNYARGGEVKSEASGSPLYSLSGLFGSGGTFSSNPVEEGAYVMELYYKPDKEHKEGLFLTGANGIILNDDTWPFDHFALEHFKDIDVPGSFWGKATLEDAIPLQVRWNTTINSIDEFNQTMGKGKWMVPHGSGFTVDPDDTHGEIIRYRPVMGHIPTLLTLKGLPNSYLITLNTIQESLDNIFSQHEVSRGTNKSDIRSGEMVSLLQEQDSFSKIPSHATFEESLEAVYRRILKRIQSGYSEERMVKVVGRDGEFEVLAFKGADLRDNTDVHIVSQSSLPDSRIARQGMIMQRYEKGLYGDPRDPAVQRQVANDLDDALSFQLHSSTRKDEAIARWENKILFGAEKKISTNPYDNDRVHLVEHSEARKRMDYQKLKLGKPELFMKIEQFFLAHEQEHSERLRGQEEAMMKRQMRLKEQQSMTGGGDKK